MAPYVKAINELKDKRDAVILAHNYQTPEIFHCVADITGDSLQLAIEASKVKASTIVQCGVHFMAETSKILNPDKTVMIPDSRARAEAARRIYYLSGGLSNVGAIARQRDLLTPAEFRAFKPLVVVRTPAQFRGAFFLWSALFFAGFLLAHAWLSLRGFRGDQALLPILLLLSGVGLILMISLRDPVRDNLLFVGFAQGAAGGALLYETFMLGNERFGRPSNPEFLLRPGELLEVAMPTLTVIAFEQGIVDQPRPAAIQRLAAVKAAIGSLPDWATPPRAAS